MMGVARLPDDVLLLNTEVILKATVELLNSGNSLLLVTFSIMTWLDSSVSVLNDGVFLLHS